MLNAYHVELDVYRGTRLDPVSSRSLSVLAETALDACVRAEEVTNVTVEDNEYAASRSVRPVRKPGPAQAMALAA